MAEKFTPQQGKIYIFPNKKNTEKQPDARGTANINGEIFDIALWTTEKNGRKYYSGNIAYAKDRVEAAEEVKNTAGDNDLPF